MLNRGLPSTDTIRVAIVEDDVLLRNALSHMVQEAEGLCCNGGFASAEEALAALPGCPPDVLLLDIGLPGIAGSDAVVVFRQAFPNMAILMLTVFSERSKVFASICNGANGYLLKSTTPSQLFEAIRAAHAGGSPISPEIAREIVDMFQKMGPPQPPALPLTGQEQQLLWLLSQGHSYEASARQMNISVNTVRNYVRSVYEKLHVHSKSAAVSTALRQGLIG
ncbi:MAG TPA: response regulator transcription factor [Terriglobales bacterium]|nr:response regulator transcription factor [Terriglobales bacterium]